MTTYTTHNSITYYILHDSLVFIVTHTGKINQFKLPMRRPVNTKGSFDGGYKDGT